MHSLAIFCHIDLVLLVIGFLFFYFAFCILHFGQGFLFLFRFGGRQIHASEDDGLVNHALVRDLDYDAARLEQFGAELEAD
jgi:hypothetical protein